MHPTSFRWTTALLAVSLITSTIITTTTPSPQAQVFYDGNFLLLLLFPAFINLNLEITFFLLILPKIPSFHSCTRIKLTFFWCVNDDDRDDNRKNNNSTKNCLLFTPFLTVGRNFSFSFPVS